MRDTPLIPIPSLYQLLPSTAIPLSSFPASLNASSAESQTVAQLGQLVSSSVAVTALHAHLASLDVPPPNQPGTGSKERRRRDRSDRGQTGGGDAGLSEEGEVLETAGGETQRQADGEHSEAETPVGKRNKERRERAEPFKRRRLPDVGMDKMGETGDLPPGDLLHAIHAHASNLFTSSHLILPTLTKESPLLPPQIVAHLDTLQADLVARENELVRNPAAKRKDWDELKRNRADLGQRIKKGLWEGVWCDAERAFEGSALVAVGLFVQILAEELLRGQDPNRQAQEQQPAGAGATPVPAETTQQNESRTIPVASTSAAPLPKPRQPKSTPARRRTPTPLPPPKPSPTAASSNKGKARAVEHEILDGTLSTSDNSDTERAPARQRNLALAPGRRRSFLSAPRPSKLPTSEPATEEAHSSVGPASSASSSDETSSEEEDEDARMDIDVRAVRDQAANPTGASLVSSPASAPAAQEEEADLEGAPGNEDEDSDYIDLDGIANARLRVKLAKQRALKNSRALGAKKRRGDTPTSPRASPQPHNPGEGTRSRAQPKETSAVTATRSLRRRTVSFDPAVVGTYKSRKRQDRTRTQTPQTEGDK